MLRRFAAGLKDAVVGHLFGVVAGEGGHGLRERGVERGVIRRGHALAVDGRTVVHAQLIQIGLRGGNFLVGRGGRGVRERGAGEYVHVWIRKLLLDDLRIVGLLDGVVRQGGGIADGAVGVAGYAALGRCADAARGATSIHLAL